MRDIRSSVCAPAWTVQDVRTHAQKDGLADEAETRGPRQEATLGGTMPRRRTSRIYTRQRGGVKRYYVDLRDLGGRQEALIPRGELGATTDPDVARHLADQRVCEVEQRRRSKTLLGIDRDAELAEFAAHHLVEKKRAGRVTDAWLADTEEAARAGHGVLWHRPTAQLNHSSRRERVRRLSAGAAERSRRHALRWHRPAPFERVEQSLSACPSGRMCTPGLQPCSSAP